MLKIRAAEWPLESYFTSNNAQTEGAILSSDCVSKLHLSPPNLRLECAPVSFRLIFLSPPVTPISTSLVLGLKHVIPSAGITFV